MHASAGEASAEHRGLRQAGRAVPRLGIVPGTLPPVGDYDTDATRSAGGLSVEGGWGARDTESAQRSAGGGDVRAVACSRAAVGAQQMCGGGADHEAGVCICVEIRLSFSPLTVFRLILIFNLILDFQFSFVLSLLENTLLECEFCFLGQVCSVVL